jgi:hypothetical protein
LATRSSQLLRPNFPATFDTVSPALTRYCLKLICGAGVPGVLEGDGPILGLAEADPLAIPALLDAPAVGDGDALARATPPNRPVRAE